MIEAAASAAAMAEKNCSGRSSFTSRTMVRTMRRPSLQVRSLLTDPAGRSS